MPWSCTVDLQQGRTIEPVIFAQGGENHHSLWHFPPYADDIFLAIALDQAGLECDRPL